MSVLYDCMVFNAVFNCIKIAAASAPSHAFLDTAQYSFQATGCFLTYPLAKQQRTVVRKE